MRELRLALETYYDTIDATAAPASPRVRTIRAELHKACIAAAELAPGLFSLHAPTGSGKTLASLAFALRHADMHNKERIVFALPFTSIIEQNAKIYRDVFEGVGDHVVLEHHSALGEEDATTNDSDGAHTSDPAYSWRQLASENWDAPVIVTTNVQLFESLFAAHPSKARKIHNLINSVVVLDEAQALPGHLLRPTLAILHELTARYGCTVVLCSATVPAVEWREEFPIGLKGMREIVPGPKAMAASMRRVTAQRAGPLDDEALADRVADHDRVLVIVNTRAHAGRLYGMVTSRRSDPGSVFHLSALMCAEHRSQRVAEIRARLAEPGDPPCIVISTQVVEAGVDLDFPVVYRAMAGLDSIVQAAGRCNRNGRLDRGEVFVFETETKPPSSIEQAAGHASEVWQEGADALDLATMERYFELHFWSRQSEWDGREPGNGIVGRMLHLKHLRFREAAAAYRLIDDWAEAVIVPFGDEGAALCRELREHEAPPRALRRRAQRYTVNVPEYTLRDLLASGAVVESPAGMRVVDPDTPTGVMCYDAELGLRLPHGPDAATMVV